MHCSVSTLLLSQAFKAIIVLLFYYNDAIQHTINLHRKGLFPCLKLRLQESWAFSLETLRLTHCLFAKKLIAQKKVWDEFFMLL